MNRTKLLLDAHQLAPDAFFTDDQTDHEIRRSLVLAFMGPDVGVDLDSEDQVARMFEAMLRTGVTVDGGARGSRPQAQLLH
ncbi:hypothetical protein [Xanthomonas sp. CFBP 8445]|uniref:hypothetical protein n=1 Tax=Xanthomonas sp. CFBP 8445 TaxID=2971236 RepID=UPI0002EFAEB7|nr:hypothetical protein [Xanthomonas sp. CFBP 8445]UYC12847.1 hypothetical protein NUG21_03625 [Xanthomonas sp. CFBP 8445]